MSRTLSSGGGTNPVGQMRQRIEPCPCGLNFYPVRHRTLDNYWIQKKLGRGKYSEVYEATNANNDEK